MKRNFYTVALIAVAALCAISCEKEPGGGGSGSGSGGGGGTTPSEAVTYLISMDLETGSDFTKMFDLSKAVLKIGSQTISLSSGNLEQTFTGPVPCEGYLDILAVPKGFQPEEGQKYSTGFYCGLSVNVLKGDRVIASKTPVSYTVDDISFEDAASHGMTPEDVYRSLSETIRVVTRYSFKIDSSGKLTDINL